MIPKVQNLVDAVLEKETSENHAALVAGITEYVSSILRAFHLSGDVITTEFRLTNGRFYFGIVQIHNGYNGVSPRQKWLNKIRLDYCHAFWRNGFYHPEGQWTAKCTARTDPAYKKENAQKLLDHLNKHLVGFNPKE